MMFHVHKMLAARGSIELTALHERHAPVDALGESFAQESFGDVSLRVQNRPDEVRVVHRFEDDLDVPLKQARLDEKAGFFREGNDDGWIGFAVAVETEAWTADAADHQRDVLEARQEECSNGGTVADVLNDRPDRLTGLEIDEVTRVLDEPHNVALRGCLLAEAALRLRLGLILQLDQPLQFRRAANAFTAHLQQSLAHGQLGDVREVVRILAQEDDTIIAGCIRFSLGLEENFLAHQQATQ